MARPGDILVVRLGAMGDIIHTLPAVATLKHSFSGCRLAWVVDPRWSVLLEGNPFVDEVIPLDRTSWRSVWSALRRLRGAGIETAVDFQGLLKSALVASMARPQRLFGYHQRQARERLAALFYSDRVLTRTGHVVDRNLELAQAAGATNVLCAFPLPSGLPEGELPSGGFVLASPLAGWPGKQWPLAYYSELASLLRRRFGLPLVLNAAPEAVGQLRAAGCALHGSSVVGLIDATRRALAVVGVDSGPLHLAAALSKPGVAIFGPTDPERNGPYGGSFTVLRSPLARTTYRRRSGIENCMKEIQPHAVLEALEQRLALPAEGGA